MDLTKVPTVLKGAAQWVCWRVERRDGKPTKVPLDPETGEYASVADPATWRDVATALTQYQRVADVAGVGFVFREEGPFAGVDLDDCRDPETGAVDEWAVDIVRQLASYTEVSPSGTGLHVIVKGRVPAGGNRRDDLELYDRNRYFTVTGDRVPGAPTTVEDRITELQAIHEKYIAAHEGMADADAAGVEQRSQARSRYRLPVESGSNRDMHSSRLDGKWDTAISKRAFYCWSARRYGGLQFYSGGLGSLGMDYKAAVVLAMALVVGSSGGSGDGPVAVSLVLW